MRGREEPGMTGPPRPASGPFERTGRCRTPRQAGIAVAAADPFGCPSWPPGAAPADAAGATGPPSRIDLTVGRTANSPAQTGRPALPAPQRSQERATSRSVDPAAAV